MAEISIHDLNFCAKNAPKEMITLAEKEYEEKVLRVANEIVNNENIKLVLLAGPSGSGKTTTANLIADAVRKHGEDAIVMSLDDFYRDHDDKDYPKLKNGEHDYECPESLNLSELSSVLQRIVNNESFEMPKYDFKIGKRTKLTRHSPIGHGCVIIEGLHALNPKISDELPKEKIIKLFVSVSTNITNGGDRIISGRKIRFIRRLVRDSIYRGSTLERTLSMWHGVLAAEDVYLYPYKSTADIAFDTFHTFELGVMKPFAEELISKDLAKRDMYLKIVLSAINASEKIDHTLIPKTSLIREFIPGGIYEELY